MLHAVKIYGVSQCPQTLRAMALLESMGIHYDFFDLENDRHAAAWVRWKNGDAPTPTVMIGLRVLAAPTEPDLRAALFGAPRPAGTAPAFSLN